MAPRITHSRKLAAMEGSGKPQKLAQRMRDLARENARLGIGNAVPAPALGVDDVATSPLPPIGEANAQP